MTSSADNGDRYAAPALGAFAVDPDLSFTPELRRAAALAIADVIGCGLAAVIRNDPVADLVRAWLDAPGPGDTSPVIGMGRRAAAEQAAFANGALCHALDFDDYTLTSWIGHPSVVLVPALLSVVETCEASGLRLLDAYAVGYEVGARLGLVSGSAHYERGWHNTATLGAVASAAAVSRLLGAGSEQATTAIALAASFAGGLRQNFGTDAKPIHAGHAARGGVTAARLAAAGATASSAALDGPVGFIRALGGDSSPDDFKNVVATGNQWDLLNPGLGYKLWPSCAYSHWAISAAQELRRSGLNADQVHHIELRCSRRVPEVCIYETPETGLQGKFSLQYCVARTLLVGSPGLDAFTDEQVRRADIQELGARIKFLADQAFDSNPWGGTLVVIDADGSRMEVTVDDPPGSPGNPPTPEQLRDKFIANVRTTGGPEFTILFDAIMQLAVTDKSGVRNLLAKLAVLPE